MAGDWIKMRANLQTHPKVVRISSALKADRLRTVGGLHAVWCLFDEHSEDGCLCGYTPDAVDELIGWPGFTQQLISVGWVEWDGQDGLELPEFDTHNGASAKRRAMEADRKRAERAAAKDGGNASASDADKKRTREEKRREEKKDTGASKSRPSISLKTYLQNCREAGHKPIPEDHAVRAYCRDAGITDEMLQVAWCVFREDYTTGTNKDKRYKDWPGHFHNAVKGCWAKLWYSDAGEVKWSSRGLQEKTVLEARMKAKEESHASA